MFSYIYVYLKDTVTPELIFIISRTITPTVPLLGTLHQFIVIIPAGEKQVCLEIEDKVWLTEYLGVAGALYGQSNLNLSTNGIISQLNFSYYVTVHNK